MTATTKNPERKPTRTDHEDALIDAIRELLGPKAVAMIAAYIQPIRTMDRDVVRQVNWFKNLLIEMVGGNDEWDRLCKEIGL